MSITTKWNLIIGAVIVFLICGIEDIKCCSGGGEKTNNGNICDQILKFYLILKNVITSNPPDSTSAHRYIRNLLGPKNFTIEDGE